MDKPWLIDELAYAGPEHLDEDFVAGFDRKQGYPDPAPDIAEFTAHGLDETSAIVDIGAGTGRFALAAATVFGAVTAVDVSPVMLAALRERAAEAGAGNLTCVPGGFLGFTSDGPPFDGVHTRHALHQLPDFWKAIALTRIAGMLREGGVLRLIDLIYDFPPEQAGEVFERWLASGARDPRLGYTAEDFTEHIRTEYSTFRWLLEPMLDKAGFDIVRVDFPGPVYGAYTCRKRG
ncbi:class I SAM-dependent methyltransferase [Saccharomonospora sp. NPDC006951]